MKQQYLVTGMTCDHCVGHVRAEVSTLPGVEGVELSLEDGLLTVTSSTPIDMLQIKEAVADAGNYSVTEAY